MRTENEEEWKAHEKRDHGGGIRRRHFLSVVPLRVC